MYPRKQSLNSYLRLSALVLVATLAGCSLNNPFGSKDRDPVVPAAAAAPSQPYSTGTQSTVPEYGGPVVQRVSEPTPIANNAPNEYVVQVGDTLWDIAETFLKDPWFWPEIWHINPEIENPHLIYPGDVLGLIYIDGAPRVTTVASTYRMSPQARITPITEAVTSVPYDSISAFLSSGAVIERREADRLPYLLDTRGDHLVASAGNEIYVRGLDNAPLGSRYNVVSIGGPLVDPDDNRTIGYQGKFVAEGTLRRGGDPQTVALTDSSQEAIRGDRLIAETVDIPLNFYPRAPSNQIDGRIISVVGGVTQIGQFQVVVLNRGTRDGLSVGDVLTVYQAGERIRDRFGGGKVTLPDEQAGTLMVFKVFDRIGYGLIMEATQAIHIHDAVRNPT